MELQVNTSLEMSTCVPVLPCVAKWTYKYTVNATKHNLAKSHFSAALHAHPYYKETIVTKW